jgi:hypothetical protein
MYSEVHAMAKAVSRRLLISEARVRSWVSPCEICGGQNGTWTGFSPSFWVLLCQYHLIVVLHTRIHRLEDKKIGPLLAAVQRQSHPIDT